MTRLFGLGPLWVHPTEEGQQRPAPDMGWVRVVLVLLLIAVLAGSATSLVTALILGGRAG